MDPPRFVQTFDFGCAITSSSCAPRSGAGGDSQQTCDACYVDSSHTVNQYASVPPLSLSCPPRTNIPYAPFSFFDMALQLDEFIDSVLPTLAEIADKDQFTQADVEAFTRF